MIKQLAPVATFAIAAAGAFGTKIIDAREKASGPIQGFAKLNLAGDCGSVHTSCETTNTGDVCMIDDNTQAWAKNGANRCLVEVYRPE